MDEAHKNFPTRGGTNSQPGWISHPHRTGCAAPGPAEGAGGGGGGLVGERERAAGGKATGPGGFGPQI
jgi:hypothetical protein